MFLKIILLKNSFENHGFLLLGHNKQLQICTLHTTLPAQELTNLILWIYFFLSVTILYVFLYVWFTRYEAGKIGSKYEAALITIDPKIFCLYLLKNN